MKIEDRGSKIEDRRVRSSNLHLLSSILVLLLAGCQSPPPPKVEPTTPLNYTAYLYSLYDTEWASRSRESVKEDRLEIKPNAKLVVARVGELAPRDELLQQIRQQTNLFRQVHGIPAVLDITRESEAKRLAEQRSAQEAAKDHVLRMRRLASDIGADYFFLIDGVVRPTVEQDFWGVLDLTIIGYFAVPSQRVESEVRGLGALIDVDSGRVLSVVTEQERIVNYAPTASVQERAKRFVKTANAKLEESLTEKLFEQLQARMAEE